MVDVDRYDGLHPVVDEGGLQSGDDRKLEDGAALCLSGGGYRAMLFHVGTIIRLNELGTLRTLKRVSSVSGGSITAAVLGLAWNSLSWDDDGVATNLDPLVVDRIVGFAGHTIDRGAILGGLLRPRRSIGDNIRRAYDKRLFDGATLTQLPTDDQGPRFVINATNVRTGKLFRFSRPYEADWTMGQWHDSERPIAQAVTASSAFPPVLSPYVVDAMGDFDRQGAGSNATPALMDKLWLSDGGVYDNLGLETAWKRYRTVLISDGGGALDVESDPKRDWAQHGMRVAGIVDGQVRALRKRQAIALYERNARNGSYWGIRSHIDDYHLDDAFELPDANRKNAQTVSTRLKKLDMSTRNDLINWGYVVADTALRKWVETDASRPTRLPRS